MTFKHSDFNSSPTMCSLTKLAREKGLIKDEPVVKTAAPKVDLTPSDSLTENLLKLCTGLRAAGFDKHAEEVEAKFVNYKQATSMYGVSDEKGEDLVHAAHPKGSHKMEDIDSKEATFEDILDKHTQMLDAVNKKPTGKLGSQDVLKAVKKVLTGVKVVTAADDLDALYEKAKAAFQKFRQTYGSLNLQMGEDANGNDQYFDVLQRSLDKKDAYQSRGLEDALSNTLNNWKNDKEPGFFADASEKQKWQDVILPMIDIANRFAQQFNGVVSNIKQIETAAKTQSVKQQYDPDATSGSKPTDSQSESSLHPIFQQINSLQLKIKSWLAVRSIAQNPGAAKWINDEVSALQDIVDRYAAVDPSQQASMTDSMTQEVNNEVKDISTFENQWVKPKA